VVKVAVRPARLRRRGARAPRAQLGQKKVQLQGDEVGHERRVATAVVRLSRKENFFQAAPRAARVRFGGVGLCAVSTAGATQTVREWHAALNSGALERLLALSTDDVEVGGPRGVGRGSQLLREWFGRAGVRMTPRRVFARGDVVVVEEGAVWPGETVEQTVASAFRVRDGRVSSVVRYADVDAALAAAGIDESTEQSET
jgi:ketosteroid isomerase-like protein